jgi:hypothetical protein
LTGLPLNPPWALVTSRVTRIGDGANPNVLYIFDTKSMNNDARLRIALHTSGVTFGFMEVKPTVWTDSPSSMTDPATMMVCP